MMPKAIHSPALTHLSLDAVRATISEEIRKARKVQADMQGKPDPMGLLVQSKAREDALRDCMMWLMDVRV